MEKVNKSIKSGAGEKEGYEPTFIWIIRFVKRPTGMKAKNDWNMTTIKNLH